MYSLRDFVKSGILTQLAQRRETTRYSRYKCLPIVTAFHALHVYPDLVAMEAGLSGEYRRTK
jgi:hypothetical protein